VRYRVVEGGPGSVAAVHGGRCCRGADRRSTARVWPRADVAQLVEHHLAKVRVAGSSPVVRSSEVAGQHVILGQSSVGLTVCEPFRDPPVTHGHQQRPTHWASAGRSFNHTVIGCVRLPPPAEV
jgi:hypothetical protein